jgi:DNA-directed RNA polymerase specialized sigma24 family protein
MLLVVELINTLPHDLRNLLIARVIEDRSYEEISRHMRLSVANARKRVQLARTKLRRALAERLG